MQGNSRPVTSAQQTLHADLEKVVRRHLQTCWQQPVAPHSRDALRSINHWLSEGDSLPLWLDSGCGTGFSTFQLARDNPSVRVIGIDQSGDRLERGANRFALPANALLLRAECADIWRLMLEKDIAVQKHFLLYPNPWPKPGHLKRRWHGHPVFPQLLALCSNLELRTNWDIYAREFAVAAEMAGLRSSLEPLDVTDQHLTDFELKYWQSGHPLSKLMIFQ